MSLARAQLWKFITSQEAIINTAATWGEEVICFLHSKCRLCVKSIIKQDGGENSARVLMRLDWHTDKGDTVIQWRHDNLATHFMVTNNQKSFYRWHIKEHLGYALVNPIDYFVISLSLTCFNVLYLSCKYWIFWLDKLLYRQNPIRGCGVVFPASDILFGCCISGYDYYAVLSLMGNKSILYF